MDDDVFDHHDGVVDDQADGGGEAAEGHEVEALADDQRKRMVTATVTGMTRPATSDERPVAQEEEEDDAGEDEADEDGVAHAGDAFADQLGLVVEGLEVDAGGQLGLQVRRPRRRRRRRPRRCCWRAGARC